MELYINARSILGIQSVEGLGICIHLAQEDHAQLLYMGSEEQTQVPSLVQQALY